MSEAKFKASKAVMDQLQALKGLNIEKPFRGVGALLWSATGFKALKEWLDDKKLSANELQLREQAIIDYCIWNKPTIELEREPRYVIEYDAYDCFYAKGEGIPIRCSLGFLIDEVKYDDGWPKEEAERLNETIKGKLVEVK